MEILWTVKFEHLTKQQIVIKFLPKEDLIKLIGQYRINNNWFDFSKKSLSSTANIDSIKKEIYSILEEMNKRIVNYEKLDEEFKHKKIEIKN